MTWTDSVDLGCGQVANSHEYSTSKKVGNLLGSKLLSAYQGVTVSSIRNCLLDSQTTEVKRLNSLWNLHPPSATEISVSIHKTWWNEMPAAPVVLWAHWLPSGRPSDVQVPHTLLGWRHADTPVICCEIRNMYVDESGRYSCSCSQVNTTPWWHTAEEDIWLHSFLTSALNRVVSQL